MVPPGFTISTLRCRALTDPGGFNYDVVLIVGRRFADSQPLADLVLMGIAGVHDDVVRPPCLRRRRQAVRSIRHR